MLDPERHEPVATDPSVSVSVSRMQGRLRTLVRGELDLATADHLRAMLEPLLAEAPELLVVDLTGVRFIDVTGLRALLDVARAQGAGGRQVLIAHPTPMLRRMLALLHLGDVLPCEQHG